jgi:hypothetical protein
LLDIDSITSRTRNSCCINFSSISLPKTGIYKIPEIQNQYAKAKDELEVIEYKRVMSKHELDNMNNQIILLRRSTHQKYPKSRNWKPYMQQQSSKKKWKEDY